MKLNIKCGDFETIHEAEIDILEGCCPSCKQEGVELYYDHTYSIAHSFCCHCLKKRYEKATQVIIDKAKKILVLSRQSDFNEGRGLVYTDSNNAEEVRSDHTIRYPWSCGPLSTVVEAIIAYQLNKLKMLRDKPIETTIIRNIIRK